ncbi:MAG: hypothetical protein NT056_06950 [Proteobacteria bacterium]|nr:hypothetical protein [Pseudomonadota bacterium]
MGKKTKAKKKTSRKIWALVFVLVLGFCAWVYWGNIPSRSRPAPAPPRPPAVAPGGVGETGPAPGEKKSSPPPAVRPRSAAAQSNPAVSEEQPLLEKIRGNEAAGRMEEAARARFELSEWYLQKALWEWTEFGRNGPDLDLIRKALAVLDEVIQLRPGTELAAEAQLRRAKVYRNGLSGLWDQDHRREAREELNKVLEYYPRSNAAREAREILAHPGK